MVGYHGSGYTSKAAAAFQVEGEGYYALDSVEVAMRRLGAAHRVRVSLTADLSGAPDESQILETFLFTDQLGGGSGILLLGQSDLHPTLTSGRQNWLVVSLDDEFDSAFWWLSPPEVISLPAIAAETNAAGDWLVVDRETGHHQAFRVTATAVPEPSSLALVFGGGIPVALTVWRNRRGRPRSDPHGATRARR